MYLLFLWLPVFIIAFYSLHLPLVRTRVQRQDIFPPSLLPSRPRLLSLPSLSFKTPPTWSPLQPHLLPMWPPALPRRPPPTLTLCLLPLHAPVWGLIWGALPSVLGVARPPNSLGGRCWNPVLLFIEQGPPRVPVGPIEQPLHHQRALPTVAQILLGRGAVTEALWEIPPTIPPGTLLHTLRGDRWGGQWEIPPTTPQGIHSMGLPHLLPSFSTTPWFQNWSLWLREVVDETITLKNHQGHRRNQWEEGYWQKVTLILVHLPWFPKTWQK